MNRASIPPDLTAEVEYAGKDTTICGVDEAGRGPWAGPVVAAAVVLDRGCIPPGLDDSKKLTPRRRAALFDAIRAAASVGVGIASVEEIDALNILRANDLAMLRAIGALQPAPEAALIDGNRVPPGLPCRARALVGGDGRSLSIAAASIVAKVTRDRIMGELAGAHPGYGWERNMGYGTAEHRAALIRLGVTPHHRRSFRPIHNILCEKHDVLH
ncbi:MAG: ribonuclease HII [Proteobacteria bacterium]|nr:ribonuclease HII [Pseudomonadota bacterium]